MNPCRAAIAGVVAPAPAAPAAAPAAAAASAAAITAAAAAATAALAAATATAPRDTCETGLLAAAARRLIAGTPSR